MSLFSVAMEKERQMQELYQELASKCDNAGLKKVLLMLADQEGNHYHNLEKASMKMDDHETELVNDVKEIFQEIKRKKDSFNLNMSQLDLYRDVKKFEKLNEEFYREKANETDDPELKQLLNNFADEERKHYMLMCEVVDFVEKPETWVECAEFNHIEEY